MQRPRFSLPFRVRNVPTNRPAIRAAKRLFLSRPAGRYRECSHTSTASSPPGEREPKRGGESLYLCRLPEVVWRQVARPCEKIADDRGDDLLYRKNINNLVAEREGFEPPVPLRVLRISSAARSTTLPPLQAFDLQSFFRD